MKKSYFSKQKKKSVRLNHRLQKRLNPEAFEQQRIQLGADILTQMKKLTPIWGGLRFTYTKTAQI